MGKKEDPVVDITIILILEMGTPALRLNNLPRVTPLVSAELGLDQGVVLEPGLSLVSKGSLHSWSPDHTEQVPLPDGPLGDYEDSDPAGQVLSGSLVLLAPCWFSGVLSHTLPHPLGVRHCKMSLWVSATLRSQLSSESPDWLWTGPQSPSTKP